MHAFWTRIHHVGPVEQILCPKIKTNPTVAISQISCSYSMATIYFGLPSPLTPSPLPWPIPQKIFSQRASCSPSTMCPIDRMHVLLSIAGICSMTHLVATFTLFSFYHHFTSDSLCKKPIWMTLSFPAWACVSAHTSHS